jgi:GNAT superfamily N-acetyltransferase
MEGARPAVAADLDRLAELARAAVEELRGTKGGATWERREARAEPFADALAAELAAADTCVLAGTIDDAVVGYAAAHIETLRDGGCLGVLSDLYVEPGAREVGVGEALLDGVLTWAERVGCIGLDGFVLPGNRASKNFFESAGMVARGIVVHRSLPRA